MGKRRTLLLQQESGETGGREWLRLLAHELTHVAQIELAQGEGRAAQWLAEGMAEWAAFRVLERLSLDTLPERRRIALAGASQWGILAFSLTSLDQSIAERFAERVLANRLLPENERNDANAE